MQRKQQKYREIGEHLAVDPQVCFGRLTFKGTRMPVEIALAYLAKHGTMEEVIRDFPTVTRRGLEEAVRLASAALVKVTRARPWESRRQSISAKRERAPRKPSAAKVAR